MGDKWVDKSDSYVGLSLGLTRGDPPLIGENGFPHGNDTAGNMMTFRDQSLERLEFHNIEATLGGSVWSPEVERPEFDLRGSDFMPWGVTVPYDKDRAVFNIAIVNSTATVDLEISAIECASASLEYCVEADDDGVVRIPSASFVEPKADLSDSRTDPRTVGFVGMMGGGPHEVRVTLNSRDLFDEPATIHVKWDASAPSFTLGPNAKYASVAAGIGSQRSFYQPDRDPRHSDKVMPLYSVVAELRPADSGLGGEGFAMERQRFLESWRASHGG